MSVLTCMLACLYRLIYLLSVHFSRLDMLTPESEHRWIAQEYLPLKQQVALVHELTKAIASEAFSGKDAAWLNEPATPKQIAQLRWLHPKLARQAVIKGWSKRTASDVITYCSIKETLIHPPQM